MALIGNCTTVECTYSDTETEEITITYGDDEGELAGTTETITVPTKDCTTTNHSDIYLCIRSVNNYNSWLVADGETIKEKEFQVDFAIYTNQATRDADKGDFLWQDVMVLHSIEIDENLYSQAYSQIKLMIGFTNLTDA
jgi:hypothetical protein